MADITSTEGRKELRRRRGRWLGNYPPLNALSDEQKEVLRLENNAIPAALDGLDIAQEAMLSAAVLEELRKPRPRTLLVRTWLHYQRVAIDMQAKALAKWDTWQGKSDKLKA